MEGEVIDSSLSEVSIISVPQYQTTVVEENSRIAENCNFPENAFHPSIEVTRDVDKNLCISKTKKFRELSKHAPRDLKHQINNTYRTRKNSSSTSRM